MFASNRVMAFNPLGRYLADVVFPARNIACTTWGEGGGFDTLYIASGKDRGSDPKEGDISGHIFAFKPKGAKGGPKFEFAG